MNIFTRIKSWFTPAAKKPTPVTSPVVPWPSRLSWRRLATIEGRTVFYDHEREILQWTAGMRIDNDGEGGNPESDKYHQSETSYRHPNGRSLNPYNVPFMVCPLSVLRLVKPFVVGSRCTMEYNGVAIDGIVGDTGGRNPRTHEERIGEASVRAAEMLGINPDPVRGGTTRMVTYTIYLGESTVIDGVAYKPRPS